MTWAQFETMSALKVPLSNTWTLFQLGLMVYNGTSGIYTRCFIFDILEGYLQLPAVFNLYACWIGLVISFGVSLLVALDCHARVASKVDKVDALSAGKPQAYRKVQKWRKLTNIIFYVLTFLIMFFWMQLFQLQIALFDCNEYKNIEA